VHFPGLSNLNNEIFGNTTALSYFPSEWSKANMLSSIDFNGDGKSEVLYINNFKEDAQKSGIKVRVYEVYKESGSYKTRILYDKTLMSVIIQDLQFGDFNGDRKTDLLLETVTTSGTNFEAWYSNGVSFEGIASLPNSGIFHSNQSSKKISDFNGDGLADVCFSENTRYTIPLNFPGGSSFNFANQTDYYIYYSTGSSFIQKTYQIGLTPPNYTSATIISNNYEVTGDFNGDGKSDICMPGSLDYFFLNSTNHLLEKAVDGYNREISFTYGKATDNVIYTKGTAPKTFPFNNIQLPMFLVSSMTAPDGVGGTTTMTYQYDNAQVYRQGLGFLGFDKITATNVKSQLITENVFDIINNTQTTTKGVSAYLRESSTYRGGQLINKTINDYILEDIGNKRWWLKLSGTTTLDGLRGTTSTSEYIYDTYGNVKQLKTNIAGVETTTEDTPIYEQHGSWIPSSPKITTSTISRAGVPSFTRVTDRRFDAQGNITWQEDFSKAAKKTITETIYNAVGLPERIEVQGIGNTKRSNAKTKTTDLTYTPNYRFLKTTRNSLGQISSTTYDTKWGKPKSVTGIDGLTTTYEYDGLGRVIEITPPQGYVIKTTYNWSIGANTGELYNVLVTHPGKPDVREHFDILERSFLNETETFGGTWLSKSKSYDHLGNVANTTSTTGVVTTYTYDAKDLLTSTDVSGIGTTSIVTEYGSKTTVTTKTPAGRIFINVSDITGKLIQKTDDAGTIDYLYDSRGLVTEVNMKGQKIVSNTYDNLGNKETMTDVNAGTTQYEFDAFGQLKYQVDAKGYETEYEYDVLGLLQTRTGGEGITEYSYMKSGPAINQPSFIKGFNDYSQDYTYDNFGRIRLYTEFVENEAFTHEYDYDIYDNPTDEKYPSGFNLKRDYDTNSFLVKVKDAQNGRVFFTGTSMDALGNYETYTLGNKLQAKMKYDEYGYPVNFTVGAVQNIDFTFDQVTGNLMSRNDKKSQRFERFTYDRMDRLTTSQVKGQNTIIINYEDNGNIASKSDAGGKYTYHKSKINAVVSVAQAQDYHDHNQSVQYTPFGQPDEIMEQAVETAYGFNLFYGADYQRKMMELRVGSVGGDVAPQVILNRRFYNGNYELDHVGPYGWGNSGACVSSGCGKERIRKIHYIEGGDGLCAIMVREGDLDSVFYVHKDYLGSLLTFTGEEGNVLYEQNFDAWGRYRNIKDWSYVGLPGRPRWLYRGYTGHEHLEQQDLDTGFFELINMNGRLYDPINGRMLSPDNLIHDDAGTQGYNRYSYAHNNPLKFTDPDGNEPTILGAMAIGAGIGVVMNGIGNLQNGQNFWKGAGDAALMGAVQGASSFGIGGAATGFLSQAVEHGLVGGFFSYAQGGTFKSGFISGAFSSVVSSGIANLNLPKGAYVAATLAAGGITGGLSSRLSGGTFVDGARNGIITAGLNHGLHYVVQDISEGLQRAAYAMEMQASDNRTYLLGSTDSDNSTWDCSKFTRAIASAFGYDIPRYSLDQYTHFQANGEAGINILDAEVGDFLYWESSPTSKHTGIVIGVNKDGTLRVLSSQVHKYQVSTLVYENLNSSGTIWQNSKSPGSFIGWGRPISGSSVPRPNYNWNSPYSQHRTIQHDKKFYFKN
jgi:RHS repeat-associated protein